MKKSVLIITAVFLPEPVVSSKLSFDIANTLSKNNEVTVISPRPSRPYMFQFETKNNDLNFKHITTNSYCCPQSNIFGRFRESYSFGKNCYQYIKKNKDSIKLIYANTWPLIAQFLTVKAANKYNIPVILHIQDIYPESFTNKIPIVGRFFKFILLPIDKYIHSHATHIIAISDKMKNYLAQTRNIHIEKLSVVKNWQDEEIFKYYRASNKHLRDNNKAFTFMYLGNIGPVAGVDLLIDAFAKADLKNARLIIAGSGSMKETLQKKTKDLNLNTIKFWSVPDGQVPQIQEQADVMLLPVKTGAAMSSIPSKLPAYMFSKRPIIASVDYDSDTSEVIRNSDCGWVITPESVDELSKLMKEIVVKTQDELLDIGNNGFNYSMKHFSKQGNLPKIIKIIENTAKG